MELVIGEESQKIHRIVLVSCHNYFISDSAKIIGNKHILNNMELVITTDKEWEQIHCGLDITLYEKAIHINLFKEDGIFQYIKNGRVNFGLDRLGNLKK